VGCRTFAKILQTHTPGQLFTESAAALGALGLKPDSIAAIQAPDWPRVDLDLTWLEAKGNSVITLADADYPAQLKEIFDPPPLLFVRGKPELLSWPQIAVVGSRNPSALGLEMAFDFAKTLSQCGFVVTSGLALGIDAASHRGALSGQGFTIAVAGTGLDRIYPARHKDLALDIVKTGAIISEFPPGTAAKANHFHAVTALSVAYRKACWWLRPQRTVGH
jgi:DNA processing protein